MQSLSPTSTGERIHAIDVIRGFAILGIFLVNMEAFNAPWLYLERGILWDSPIDIASEVFIDIFAQSSFYTLFSFLFGFGMVMFMERAIEKGYSFVSVYSRRHIVLLAFGIIHAFLIWHGDILIFYAIVGFILLLFIKAKPKTLLIWALSLIIIPSMLISFIFKLRNVTVDSLSRYKPELVNKSLEVYSSGTFVEITSQRIEDWLYGNGGFTIIFLILILLPMFLLGSYVAIKKWFHDVESNLTIIKRIWIISFIIGGAFKIFPYIFKESTTLYYLQDHFGGPGTALFYATSILLLFRYNIGKKILSNFASVGRLSLSNYLFQSILTTTIFYGYGFGFYGEISPFYGLILTFTIFAIQIVLSNLWLRKFRIGPFEWVWRSLTYGQRLPFKKAE